jgi:hypothetical protein
MFSKVPKSSDCAKTRTSIANITKTKRQLSEEQVSSPNAGIITTDLKG